MSRPRTAEVSEEHPEATCERCARPNVTWFAPSPIWNAVMRDPATRLEDRWSIICPVCFVELAEAAGTVPTAWSLQPELRAATPSTPGLDVRRVVEAVQNVAKRHGIAKDPPVSQSVASIWGYSAAPAVMDAEIAAEYAALTSTEGEPK